MLSLATKPSHRIYIGSLFYVFFDKSVMNTAQKSSENRERSIADTNSHLRVLLPYGLAVLAQMPMLLLYFKGLWGKPHYQFFPFAIAATAYLAWIRWPKNIDKPYIQSLPSDILLGLGVLFAIGSFLFMAPWFSAVSAVLLATSLFARTVDVTNKRTLWTCALPLFICISLPVNLDNVFINRLQSDSAIFSSQLMDLIGMGHYMNGVEIIMPSGKEFKVEEGCSGVVSFFTLLAIATVFVVWTRRTFSYPLAFRVFMLVLAFLMIFIELIAVNSLGYISLAAMVIAMVGLIGFHAGILLASVIFWALFMNTVRIILIPFADTKLDGLDLSTGIPHQLLGYSVLVIGALLVFSTDQFLLFLFGPVDDEVEQPSGLQKPITKFWNRFFSGKEKSSDQNKLPKGRPAFTYTANKVVWGMAIGMMLMGLIQAWQVQRSWAKADLQVTFFDSNPLVEFEKSDLPGMVKNWEQVDYATSDRTLGSDLGQRSDVWIYQGPRCSANTSIDQTFPGWHELTTCYKNQGWQLISRKVYDEDEEGETGWPYVEAQFTRKTGEKGYLLFSLFDSQAEPVDAPISWNKLNSFFIRVKNRLSNRIRATLFDAEAYQTQIFVFSYREIDDELKQEIREKYLESRELIRQRFIEKRKAGNSENLTRP